MGAPTVYSWDDPGAPAWTASVNGLYEVLLACLVNGYPGKAGAGWSVVYDDWVNSGNVSFANAAQSGVLGLWHPLSSDQSYAPLVYIAEAMQGPASPIRGLSHGVVVTNTAALSMSATGLHFVNARNSGNPKQWVLIASDNFAIMIFDRNASGALHGNPQAYSAVLSGTIGAIAYIAFGAIGTRYGLGDASQPELGNFFLVGGARARESGSLGLGTPSAMTHLRFFTLGPVTSERYSLISPYAGGTYFPGYLGETQLVPWLLYTKSSSAASLSGASQGGRVPGFFAPRDAVQVRDQDDVDVIYPGGYSFKTPVVINGKQFLFGVFCGGNPVYVSLDPADWV